MKDCKKNITKYKKYNLRTNKRWSKISKSKAYQAAVLANFSQNIDECVKNDFADAICLTFDKQSQQLSSSYKKRLLRRIAEKRYAQFVHSKLGDRNTHFLSHLTQHYCSKCISTIQL